MTELRDESQFPSWPGELRKALEQFFSESDIESLCFDLRIDYEALPGESKPKKIIELIWLLARSGQIAEFIDLCSQYRPNVPWENLREAAVQSPLVDYRSLTVDASGAHSLDTQADAGSRIFSSRIFFLVFIVVVSVIATISLGYFRPWEQMSPAEPIVSVNTPTMTLTPITTETLTLSAIWILTGTETLTPTPTWIFTATETHTPTPTWTPTAVKWTRAPLVMTTYGANLYVIENATLHRINPSTGEYSNLGQHWGVDLIDITALGDFLYVIENGTLWRVDPSSGDYTNLGRNWTVNPTAITALGGFLYVIENETLWRVDPSTGDYTNLGRHWIVDPIAMTVLSDRLYIIENGRLWEVNPADGAYTPLR